MFVVTSILTVIFTTVHISACELENDAVENASAQTLVQINGDNVRLDCNISQYSSQAVWQRKNLNGEKVLYAGLIAIKDKNINNIEIISKNYSLILYNITSDDIAVYMCKQCGQTLASYNLKVIAVLPELRIQYGGIHVTNDTIFVHEGTPIQLNCIVFGTEMEPDIEWHVENASLKEHKETINKSVNRYIEGKFDFSKILNYLINDNKTEIICSISLDYINSSVSVTISKKPWNTAAHHELRIRHEGRNVTEAIVMYKERSIQLECVVFGAINEPSIVWQVENNTLAEQTGEIVRSSNHFVDGTFDFMKPLTYFIERNTELICHSLRNKSINVSIIIAADVSEKTAFSTLRVHHRGKNASDTIVVEKAAILQIDCVVYGVKTEPTITWKVKNTSLAGTTGDTTNSSNLFVAGTFDFRKTLTYMAEDETTLTCSSLGISWSINVSFRISSNLLDKKDKSAGHETVLISFSYAAAIAVFAVFIVSVCSVLVYMKLSRGVSRSKAVQTRRSPKRESSPQHSEPFEPGLALEKSRFNECQDIISKEKRTLPKEPNSEDSYARYIHEEDLYSEVSYNMQSGGVYSRKRICLISKLFDGAICERWMGNLTSIDGGKKYVFISCLKDAVYGKPFHWDEFVKTLLELPECTFMFRTEGLCLDKSRLFLLQGYMTCESLVEYISTKTKEEKAWKNHQDLLTQLATDLSVQVTTAMEFVMTHRLSHPGLSVKKILVTEDGVCKLYDFCVAEDALQFLECLKLEADFSSSSHPSECVNRNEYTCGSDVWYTGFTVREIFYAMTGSPQGPLSTSLPEKNMSTNYLPSECGPLSVNECLKDCLILDYNQRPKSLKELLGALKIVADSLLISQSELNAPEGSMGYTPMNMEREVTRQ